MKIYTLLLMVLINAPVVAADIKKSGGKTDVLATLRAEHPRLVVLDEDLVRVRRMIKTDPEVRKLRDELHKQAEKLLAEPTVVHKPKGPRLLYQSRLCLWRVYMLAAMYRLGGDERFARRAEKELLAAAAFKDWNPRHFLDTAEVTHALAIGYDWLYDFLSADSREKIRTVIIEKGLKPALQRYRGKEHWVSFRHNWNQVCNGGIVTGALAIADEEPQMAGYIVAQANQSIRLPTAELAPVSGSPNRLSIPGIDLQSLKRPTMVAGRRLSGKSQFMGSAILLACLARYYRCTLREPLIRNFGYKTFEPVFKYHGFA